MAVDVTSGFCSEGPLASERVGAIVDPIVQIFARAHEVGVRHFILPPDQISGAEKGDDDKSKLLQNDVQDRDRDIRGQQFQQHILGQS